MQNQVKMAFAWSICAHSSKYPCIAGQLNNVKTETVAPIPRKLRKCENLRYSQIAQNLACRFCLNFGSERDSPL